MSILRLFRGIGAPGGGRRVAARFALLGGTLALAVLLAVLVPRCIPSGTASDGLQITSAANVMTGHGDVLALTARDTGAHESPLRLVLVDPRRGTMLVAAPLAATAYRDPVELADDGAEHVLLRSSNRAALPELRDATTAAIVQTVPVVTTALDAALTSSRVPGGAAEVAALPDGRELRTRSRDGRSTIAVSKNGIAQSAPATVFWNAAFLADDRGALAAPDASGFFVASVDSLERSPRFLLTRLDPQGAPAWARLGTPDEARAPRLLARVTGDAVVIVFAAPASEVVAYDLGDGHVRWRVTP